MKKNGQLLLFQVDHLSGEEIGYLIDRVYIWGAKNVHAIPTVTKKGRPGYIILVDAGDREEATLVESMAMEFGLFGYHQIQTIHWHQTAATKAKSLKVRYKGKEIATKIHFKFCGPEKAPVFARVEHDDVIATQNRLQKIFGLRIPHYDLRQRLNIQAKEKNLTLDLNDKRKGKKKAG
jgi:pyridinium-3,5-bisthiocarboxylic acid mononucleotide nickel chelatase